MWFAVSSGLTSNHASLHAFRGPNPTKELGVADGTPVALSAAAMPSGGNERRSRSQRWFAVATEVSPAKTTADHATATVIDPRTLPFGHLHVRPAPPASPGPPRRRRHASAPIEGGERYELGALIGRGGMGEVFAAYDAQLGREVAIKRLHPDKLTPSSLARFLREARIQGWLDHPAIPSVYDLGRDDQGRPFFAMKRLSGVTLDEILAARETNADRAALPQFTEQALLRAFVEICLAIEFAHTRGVLHRDLKPANMLLGEFGEVYVFDWGVARIIDELAPATDPTRPTLDQVTNTAGVLGTPGYMSPEQVCGGELDGRADVYALGCVLFEILVGRRVHPSGLAGMTSALAGVTASPSKYRDDLAPELDDLCRRATAADRGDRISSARALGEGVQRYLDGDRDLALRRRLARAHLDMAQRASEEATHAMRSGGLRRSPNEVGITGEACLDFAATSIAMREAGRALALDPSLPGAAELVGRLMLQPAPRTPATVAAEFEDAELPEQLRMAKVSIATYAGYACVAPLLLAFGIRDAPYLCALVAIALGNIAIASVTLVQRRPAPRIVVALGHAAMVGLIARMFTPLFIAPGITALTLMAYAQHAATRRRDLASGSALAIAAVLGVWGAEALGWISATTVIDGGVIRLAPPLEGVAGFPIVPALCCYSILLVAVATEFAYSVARRGRDARRGLHVQAWHLRQLVSLDAPPRRG